MPAAEAAILKPGREQTVLHRHPWIFSGAVEVVEGRPESGGTVRVLDSTRRFLAHGAYSPESNIRIRTWNHQEHEAIDAAFIRERILRAVDGRNRSGLLDLDNTACRLVSAESDGLPGLIADRYGSCLVLQFLSAGAERLRKEIAAAFKEMAEFETIYERSDVDVRAMEGLPARKGMIEGQLPERPVEIREDGLLYLVDVVHGHKTGFYLDQRFNRKRVRELSAGCDVLNGFAYTGGFSAAALAGGARRVMAIEASADAIRLGDENLRQNSFPAGRHEWVEGDVFVELRKLRDHGKSFDLIVLDPPKFAANRSQVDRAARGYKDINLLAFKLLRPGGILVTFSCSGGVSADLFQKIVAGAALDAGCCAQIIERLTQGPDHPVGLNFPESEYLKGLVIRKTC